MAWNLLKIFSHQEKKSLTALQAAASYVNRFGHRLRKQTFFCKVQQGSWSIDDGFCSHWNRLGNINNWTSTANGNEAFVFSGASSSVIGRSQIACLRKAGCKSSCSWVGMAELKEFPWPPGCDSDERNQILVIRVMIKCHTVELFWLTSFIMNTEELSRTALWKTARCLHSFCGWWQLSCRWGSQWTSFEGHDRGRDKPPWSVRDQFETRLETNSIILTSILSLKLNSCIMSPHLQTCWLAWIFWSPI